MANKLYELLAVEQDRKHKANQALGRAKNVFVQKPLHFDGMLKQYVALEENADVIPDERKEIVITVQEQIAEASAAIIKGLDANLSKEETNSANVAKAELIIDEVNFGTFSATSLLALESYLNKLKELYNAVPVLDSAKKWAFDEKENVYKTEEEVKFRSVKRPKVIVKYEATEKHPAQTELLYLDFQVGKYVTTNTSGRVTLTQKKTMVQRVERLMEAVKIARSKANNIEVVNVKMGEKLFNFIHKDII